jgi:hypothetical protein
MLTTRSKAPAATGRFSASPSSNLMFSFSRAARARLIERIGRDVDAGNARAGLRRRYGEVAVAAGDVEHLYVRFDLAAVDEIVRRGFGQRGHGAIISRHPGRPDAGLEGIKVCDRLDGHASILSSRFRCARCGHWRQQLHPRGERLALQMPRTPSHQSA